MRTSSASEWNHFKSKLPQEQKKLIDVDDSISKAVRGEDFIKAQELACSLLYGNGEVHISVKLSRILDDL